MKWHSLFSVQFKCVRSRVARWHIFEPTIPIWVNFGGPWNGKGWYILWPFGIYLFGTFGIYFGHLVLCMAIWYSPPSFGILCQEQSGNPAHMYDCNGGGRGEIQLPSNFCTFSLKLAKWLSTNCTLRTSLDRRMLRKFPIFYVNICRISEPTSFHYKSQTAFSSRRNP
jgi:hypothetical protein